MLYVSLPVKLKICGLSSQCAVRDHYDSEIKQLSVTLDNRQTTRVERRNFSSSTPTIHLTLPLHL